jgi:hypothetical protein
VIARPTDRGRFLWGVDAARQDRDSDRRQIPSEYALVARNEKSSGDHELGHVFIHHHIESLLRGATTSRPLHSITSSARPSSERGKVTPSAVAALRLMISSTFVAC